jgi:hypothetical protein
MLPGMVQNSKHYNIVLDRVNMQRFIPQTSKAYNSNMVRLYDLLLYPRQITSQRLVILDYVDHSHDGAGCQMVVLKRQRCVLA